MPGSRLLVGLLLLVLGLPPLGVELVLPVGGGLAFEAVERIFDEPDVAAEGAFYLVEARFLFFEVVV